MAMAVLVAVVVTAIAFCAFKLCLSKRRKKRKLVEDHREATNVAIKQAVSDAKQRYLEKLGAFYDGDLSVYTKKSRGKR